jgi:hypothetical protein
VRDAALGLCPIEVIDLRAAPRSQPGDFVVATRLHRRERSWKEAIVERVSHPIVPSLSCQRSSDAPLRRNPPGAGRMRHAPSIPGPSMEGIV